MASQIYSRYTPPTKRRKITVVDSQPSDLPTIQKQHSISLVGETRPDTSSTYARYVPSSKSKLQVSRPAVAAPQLPSNRKYDSISEVEDVQGEVFKKGRGSKSVESIQPESPVPASLERVRTDSRLDKLEESNVPVDPVKRIKRKKGKDGEIRGGVVNEEPFPEEDSRHKTILSKKIKALKKAETLAEENTLKDVASRDREDEGPEELHPLAPFPQPKPVSQVPGKPAFALLPSWMASPISVSLKTTEPFKSLGIPKEVVESLHASKFESAFAVQVAVIPLLLPVTQQEVGDVLVSAATGSGKTLAYVLPMIDDISTTSITRLRALIVMPTRELVTQARDVCENCAIAYRFGSRRRVRIGIAVGSQTLKAEQASLMEKGMRYDPEEYERREHKVNSRWEISSNGSETYLFEDEEPGLPNHVIEWEPKVDILICTPGRLVEHLKSTPGFTLDYVRWLVIDEADKLLDQSYQQWLGVAMSKLQKGVRKVVLSATMTRDLGQLSTLKLHRPKLVVLEGSEENRGEILSLPATLWESAVKVEESNKPLYFLELIRTIRVASDDESSSSDSSSSDDSSSHLSKQMKPTAKPRGVLVFTKSNENALRLSRLIGLLDSSLASEVGTLTSTIKNSIRKATLNDFQAGRRSILVASDLVARGLDLPNLQHVINYDMATSLTNYVHRVGRTARAGNDGHAWTLFTAAEARWFWNEIARSVLVQRLAKVERLNLKVSFDQEKYENALAALGEEAGPGHKK